MDNVEKQWFENGLMKRRENPAEILVFGAANHTKKRGGAKMAKKPKGHKAGCKCAICERRHSKKHAGGHGKKHGNTGSHPMARRRNDPGGAMGKFFDTWFPVLGLKESAAAVVGGSALPLIGKLGLVLIPWKPIQEGFGNILGEFLLGGLVAGGVGRLDKPSAKVLATLNIARSSQRLSYLVTKGRIGLADGAENPVVHLGIDEAVGAMLPAMNDVLPGLRDQRTDDERRKAGDTQLGAGEGLAGADDGIVTISEGSGL